MADLAYQDFREALRLRPGNPDAQLNLGNAFAALGQRDSACHYWSKARRNGAQEVEKQLAQYCNKAEK
jgi:tetratricopeptide (TPR) repeat protein